MVFNEGASHREGPRREFLKRGAVTAGALFVGVPAISRTAEAAPTEIDECTTIDESGTYVLTDDLSAEGTCIRIARPGPAQMNVTIDGAGHTISGDGTGFGILATPPGGGEINIRNLEVVGFDTGIRIIGGLLQVTATLEDVRIHDNEETGVQVDDAILNLYRSTVADNSGDGILVQEATSMNTIAATIVDNEIRRNANAGIRILFGEADIRNNTIASNQYGVFLRDPPFPVTATITHNNIENNDAYGVFDNINREVFGEPTESVEATCNYWGHATGPVHDSNPRPNPKGDRVSDNVAFIPWSIRRIRDGTGKCVGGLNGR